MGVSSFPDRPAAFIRQATGKRKEKHARRHLPPHLDNRKTDSAVGVKAGESVMSLDTVGESESP